MMKIETLINLLEFKIERYRNLGGEILTVYAKKYDGYVYYLRVVRNEDKSFKNADLRYHIDTNNDVEDHVINNYEEIIEFLSDKFKHILRKKKIEKLL